jgi:hypothetical protein
MSCCNNRPTYIVYPPCTSDCPEPDAVVAQNDNLAGYGVLDRQEGQSLYFRGIAAGSYITVDIDADDKAIVIDVDPDLINSSLPDASETVKGKIALATSVEVLSGLEDTKAVTPLNLALLTATVARRGMVELATSIEAAAGTDSERAVTPSALDFVLASYRQTTNFADAAARALATPDNQWQLAVQQDTGALYYADNISVGDWSPINLDSPTVSGTVNFVGNTWKIDSVAIPANSVVITGGSAGTPSSKLLSEFMSTSSTLSDYTIGSFSETRTFDSSSTLPTLIDVVATLISDLYAMRRVRTV